MTTSASCSAQSVRSTLEPSVLSQPYQNIFTDMFIDLVKDLAKSVHQSDIKQKIRDNHPITKQEILSCFDSDIATSSMFDNKQNVQDSHSVTEQKVLSCFEPVVMMGSIFNTDRSNKIVQAVKESISTKLDDSLQTQQQALFNKIPWSVEFMKVMTGNFKYQKIKNLMDVVQFILSGLRVTPTMYSQPMLQIDAEAVHKLFATKRYKTKVKKYMDDTYILKVGLQPKPSISKN